MKFNIIIGNPPYQEMTGGGTTTESSMPLYHLFIEKAMNMGAEYITMVIPSRWMSGGKSVLDDFRRKMIECNNLEKLYNFEQSQDVFPDADIAGGVQYFLLNKRYHSDLVEFHNIKGKDTHSCAVRCIGNYKYTDSRLKEQYLIISDNTAQSIVNKVINNNELRMDASHININPFDIGTDFEDSDIYSEDKSIAVIKSGDRVTYTSESNITKNYDMISKYKVCVGKLSGEHGGAVVDGKQANVISNPFILKPNQVCTGTYVVIGAFETEEQAENMLTYIKTKFVRYLIYITLSGMHLSTRNYMFVPVQDYNKPWTDKELYEKYELIEEEIRLIDNKIKQLD